MTGAENLLDRLPRTSLIVGKGGVGKTTIAVGLAALFARRGERTLVVSTDPAAALGAVIGEPVAANAMPIGCQPNLDARQLAAAPLRAEFLDRWRDTIAEIVDRGTYLDRGDVDGLVDAALPGADEIFALLALADLLAEPSSPYARIVIDTAPTGHTLRLLALPETFAALLSLLDIMQAKHRFMVRALTHRYRRDGADDFIDGMRARIDGLRATLVDERELAAVVVTRDEPMVAAETARYVDSLRGLQVHVAVLVANAVERWNGGTMERWNIGVPRYWIPRAAEPPRDLSAVVESVERMKAVKPAGRRTSRRAAHVIDLGQPVSAASLVRTLTIVGGKGGVGKSTVACALALAAVDASAQPTLLVSTDPAPSIADAFDASNSRWARGDTEQSISEAPGLVVRQMDAGAAFTRIRDQYQDRIDSLFESIAGRGVDVAHDRAIVRDLFGLAPPGIDELFALSLLGDALAEGRFARIIVDPAPTGHLLRLLDMPAMALDWTHRLMRLLLKYRDIVELGDTAQELLDFAKRTRALEALLHDRDRTALILVALNEPVVRAETERLVSAAHDRSINVEAIIWNRVHERVSPLTTAPAARQVFGGEASPPPVGIAALRNWAHSWCEFPSIT
ncbi:MAG: ArsA family ATPase [Gemmatimonadaceae bacterium]